MSDLDFDTDGDGASFTVIRDTTTQITATGDEEDAYYNGGSGWDPDLYSGAARNLLEFSRGMSTRYPICI